ncbi:MAG: methylenetetrahydrofolate--tRNA-(uracil(54)-C(5))-methyltransferase (FADH(2)-oxidizing) TrmFO [Candidatus Dadabacteria bacterium]|nr:MAG: methylenetetrahydrofolate--tRNA-(uracil(54)-C(5))-methyltransferase (FADH(2)-oxidizing) TrmFO [Candidatus Dadabacteria bacterium]
MKSGKEIIIAGGGLAGSEAAHAAAKTGVRVRLYEMRPLKPSPAHNTGDLGELVCSNSLKSDSLDNASGILKEEMRHLGSLVLEAAERTRVPAGKALAVDRAAFAQYITESIEKNPLIELVREEFYSIPDTPDTPLIIATGPLTSEPLAQEIRRLTESDRLYFYDAISPIIDGDSIDYSRVYRASRYEDGETGEGDYLNCPLNKEEYYALVEEISGAEKVETRDFEKGIYFESCLPVEEIVERGRDTLRFGPARPVGLRDPRTGSLPYAVLQLRAENRERSMYNMVGFQTKLRYPEQRRIFRMMPGLEKAEFMRYGSVHRNTYIDSPRLLRETLQLIKNDNIFFAGQIVGVEGYIESAAMGIIAGINAARMSRGESPVVPPPETATGSLLRYISDGSVKNFQPMNINFGLFPPPGEKIPKSLRKSCIAERALSAMSRFDPFVQASG